MRKLIPAALVAVFLLLVPLVSVPSDAVEGDVRTIYDSLDSEQKTAYKDLETAVRNFTSLDDLDYLSISQGEEVFYAFMYDHPEYFWFRNCYTMMVVSIENRMSSIDYNGQYTPQEITKMRVSIANSLRTLDVDTSERDYKQLRTIHDWLCERIDYVEGEHQGDIYGALVLGEAVCEGYSTAFSYICRMYGFDCVVVVGYTYTSDTVAHAWNLVHGEGDWYFVDVTWDDEGDYASHKYFLLGSETSVDGRSFASENHMADSLYGIVPAEKRFYSQEDILKLVAALVIAVTVLVIMIIYHHRKKKATSVIVVNEEPSTAVFSGNVLYCPECGSPIGDEYSFCTACGAEITRPQSTQNPEETVQEEPPMSGSD